jgi:hypothetical protein
MRLADGTVAISPILIGTHASRIREIGALALARQRLIVRDKCALVLSAVEQGCSQQDQGDCDEHK